MLGTNYYRTGGQASRDWTFVACHDISRSGLVWDMLSLSGPIDAPDTMPAGAVACDARGRNDPQPRYIRR